jgi:hypothetical protein
MKLTNLTNLSNYCYLGCGISLIFIIGMIYMSFSIDKSNISEKFKKTLNTEQLNKYREITNERIKIYYSGYILGFLISIGLILFNLLILQKTMSKIEMVCLTGGVSFLTTYFYYILSNKSEYMIMNLQTDIQKNAWLEVYKKMQFNYHTGLVLGIISVMILSFSFC